MESGGENHPTSGKSGGCNGGGLSWDIWELGGPWGGALHHAPAHHAVPSTFFNPTQPTTLNTMSPSPSFFSYHHDDHHHAAAHGGGDAYHLTCLKLGKRQYYEESHASDPAALAGGMKKERVASSAAIGVPSPAAASAASSSSLSSAAASAVVPRCQVEGCNVALVDAKDYHRRHKVCEMHSKAPKVVVLGMEQRFCQQCSRFHVITEFDESKRSCRRRLAGHNERRRKSSAESIIRNPPHLGEIDSLATCC
ncbi:hypothetical protein Taro_011415 [Colocasia esculenta]|uniref:SBP-type domain-containing protein n=1 Tax=Colocasia esculenta TaxID=4460 RepID=A0A843UAJ6_COLES|nr:hypothetical protein [Colocasia esculenta]